MTIHLQSISQSLKTNLFMVKKQSTHVVFPCKSFRFLTNTIQSCNKKRNEKNKPKRLSLLDSYHWNPDLTQVSSTPIVMPQNPGVPLTTRKPTEFLWISDDPIPQCCVPFIRIHIFTKHRAESSLFGELYPTYNLYNHNPSRVSTEVVMTTQGPFVHILNIQLYHNYPWTPSYSAPPQYIPLPGSIPFTFKSKI